MLLGHFADELPLPHKTNETAVSTEREAEPSPVLIEPRLAPTERKCVVTDGIYLGHSSRQDFFGEGMVSVLGKQV